VAGIDSLSSCIILDLVHLKLNSFEDLLELLGLQRNDLVVISDFLDIFNLFSLCLGFHSCYLIFKVLLQGKVGNHVANDLLTICRRVIETTS